MFRKFLLTCAAVGLLLIAQGAIASIASATPCLVKNGGPCSVSGTKFNDLNANGAKDNGEPGLGGFRFYADYDSDGVLDPGEPFDDSDATGAYKIEGINCPTSLCGNLQAVDIREVSQNTWICSFPSGCAYLDVSFEQSKNRTGKNFGNWTPGQISGLKFNDVNGNGAQDPGEGGLAGFTFYLDLNDNSTFDPGEPSAQSDATGVFTITGITPGTYTLRETGGGAGYTCTFPAGCSYQVGVTSHQQVSGKNFGNKPPETPTNPPVTPSGGTNAAGTGSAKVSSPSGCVSTRFKVRVSGSKITKVEIRIDGKLKKKFTGNGGSRQSFSYKVNTKKYDRGVHKLSTKTTFTTASGTPVKRTSSSFQRCGRQSVIPKFTG